MDRLVGGVKALVEKLLIGLDDKLTRDAIIVAHWRAQSYKYEQHTDLWDFCHLLGRACNRLKAAKARLTVEGDILTELILACEEVKDAIVGKNKQGMVIKLVTPARQCSFREGFQSISPGTRVLTLENIEICPLPGLPGGTIFCVSTFVKPAAQFGAKTRIPESKESDQFQTPFFRYSVGLPHQAARTETSTRTVISIKTVISTRRRKITLAA